METLVSQALIDMEISHEECITILKEIEIWKKNKYGKIKENIRAIKSSNEGKKLKQQNYRGNA